MGFYIMFPDNELSSIGTNQSKEGIDESLINQHETRLKMWRLWEWYDMGIANLDGCEYWWPNQGDFPKKRLAWLDLEALT